MGIVSRIRAHFKRWYAQGIIFLPLYDGETELLLKEKLRFAFRFEKRIELAYLVYAQHSNTRETTIILGIKAPEEQAIIEKTAVVFASIFDAKQHLDILFISDEQERQIQAIAFPFYKRAATDRESD